MHVHPGGQVAAVQPYNSCDGDHVDDDDNNNDHDDDDVQVLI